MEIDFTYIRCEEMHLAECFVQKLSPHVKSIIVYLNCSLLANHILLLGKPVYTKIDEFSENIPLFEEEEKNPEIHDQNYRF